MCLCITAVGLGTRELVNSILASLPCLFAFPKCLRFGQSREEMWSRHLGQKPGATRCADNGGSQWLKHEAVIGCWKLMAIHLY